MAEVAVILAPTRTVELTLSGEGGTLTLTTDAAALSLVLGTVLRGERGADGADGPAGADGASAYEVAVADGFVGTEAEWLASLVGADGAPGEQGPQGPEGPQGPQGDSMLTAEAANVAALRNGVNPQDFRVYSAYTDAANYERISIRFESGAFRIGPQRAGSGSQRALYVTGLSGEMVVGEDGAGFYYGRGLGVNPTKPMLFGNSSASYADYTANGSHRFNIIGARVVTIDNTGLKFGTDNAYDIGTPALRIRAIHAVTAPAGTNTTQVATTAFVRGEVAALVDSSPGTLDTLNELAQALGDDPNFAATTAAQIAAKQDALVSGTNVKTINGASILGAGDITTGSTYVDVYDTPGAHTWTKRAGAKVVEGWIVSGGGGGGSGRRGATTEARGGGASGASAAVVTFSMSASALAAEEAVVVGEGGAGGAVRTTDASVGATGLSGGVSSFIGIAAGRGLGGGGGSTSTRFGGTGASLGAMQGFAGSNGADGKTADGGAATTVQHPGTSGGGGGAGAGASSTLAAVGGAGAGRAAITPTSSGVSVTVAGALGGTDSINVAETGRDGVLGVEGGLGGGGGYYRTGEAGGNGGNGGFPGGGGGGGGASDNGFDSGAGGNGGDGCVVVITYC